MAVSKKKTTPAPKSKKAVAKTVEKKSLKGAETAVAAKKEEKLVTIDRRRNPERRKKEESAPGERHPLERRAKVNRRRQIDPTTCERDYTMDEIEFMKALDDYKRANGRMFPTCSEVLEVIRKLGYEKRPVPAPIPVTEAPQLETSSPAAAV